MATKNYDIEGFLTDGYQNIITYNWEISKGVEADFVKRNGEKVKTGAKVQL